MGPSQLALVDQVVFAQIKGLFWELHVVSLSTALDISP